MTTRSHVHRVLGYLRACVEAEHAASQFRVVGARNVLLLESGPAALDAGVAVIDRSDRSARWIRSRASAGANELLWSGWPVVRAHRRVNGRQTEVAATLLFTEVALAGDARTGHRLVPTSRAVELDEAALVLLGVHADERELLLRDFASVTRPGALDPLERAMEFLHDAALVDGRWDPRGLGPLDRDAIMSNTGMVWAGDAEQSPFTRQLIQDLDALAAKPTAELAAGPLGVLLGSTESEPSTMVEATPAVLPTTLEQERAICSALHAPLTVVTGPPGTGKSQVLANSVSAALDNGESVLLASKNNHAIDVVHRRVAGMHPDSVPLRAGRSSYRASVAQAMGHALSQRRPETSGLVAARETWQRTKERVAAPYRALGERVQTIADLDAARAALDESRKALPTDVTIDPLLVDADLLAASVNVARRRLVTYSTTPNRWFWQKRRHRAAERDLDDAVEQVAVLAGDGARTAARRTLVDGGSAAVVDLGAALVDYVAKRDDVTDLERKVELLPPTSAVDDEISESFAVRADDAVELFAASWRERLRPTAPGRAAARQYQSGLAARAERGSAITPLRGQLSNALDVFPVWAVTSLAAGAWFPLVSGLFDLVIIDEASQSDIASALPLVYRARRAMVVGDPHQLTHITNLGAGMDAQLASKHGLSDDDHGHFSYRDSSLFGLAASRLAGEPVFLNRHFRSHPDVIGFSNAVFYGGRLSVETDPERFLPGPGFEWIDVRGEYEPGPGGRSTKNPVEAERVVELLIETVSEIAGSGKSVGVVTPFAPQRDLLVDLKAARLADVDVTIDTAHGFQGDERDVMIVSMTVTDGSPPGLVRFAANPNLLNVALTRARARTIVVGDAAFARSSDSLLADLASYADRVADGSIS